MDINLSADGAAAMFEPARRTRLKTIGWAVFSAAIGLSVLFVDIPLKLMAQTPPKEDSLGGLIFLVLVGCSAALFLIARWRHLSVSIGSHGLTYRNWIRRLTIPYIDIRKVSVIRFRTPANCVCVFIASERGRVIITNFEFSGRQVETIGALVSERWKSEQARNN